MDEDELYKAMEYFLLSPKQINFMGEKSSILAQEKLSLDVISDQYLQLFAEE